MGEREGPLEGMGMMVNLDFYCNKRVLVTGHTGFKGSWLCTILANVGAEVTGYALEPPTGQNLYSICGMDKKIQSVIGDIRDYTLLQKTIKRVKPEVAFHLAAQPIVREGYKNPRTTYETNVMGTVNLMECIRSLEAPPLSVVNITTDKVYQNKEWVWGYRETDELDGYDPYSNSKSCSELVTHSYINSFFKDTSIAVSTVRAGNVIGGGDFASDRIIPDCVYAALQKQPIIVRNPFSVRPYQHVLEPLFAYLMIAQAQYQDNKYAGYYNVGPDDCDCLTTGKLVDLFCRYWDAGLTWESKWDEGPHESGILKLDCSKLKSMFGWHPRWHIETAIEKTVEWTKVYTSGGDVLNCMEQQIAKFTGGEV